jgi:transcriptional regulator with XRE-family HTH domain
MADVQAYARWLKRTRESVKPRLTQPELAEKAGVSGNNISRLEKNWDGNAPDAIHHPHEVRVDAISRALEVFVGRPLVNEARQVLGYGLVADSPVPAPLHYPAGLAVEDQRLQLVELLLSNPTAAEDIAGSLLQILRFPQDKQREAKVVIDALARRSKETLPAGPRPVAA